MNVKRKNSLPTRSLGTSSLTVESDLEKLRLAGVWIVSLGVALGMRSEPRGSITLMSSASHFFRLFKGSLLAFPPSVNLVQKMSDFKEIWDGNDYNMK